jgi:hypothetical protein
LRAIAITVAIDLVVLLLALLGVQVRLCGCDTDFIPNGQRAVLSGAGLATEACQAADQR